MAASRREIDNLPAWLELEDRGWDKPPRGGREGGGGAEGEHRNDGFRGCPELAGERGYIAGSLKARRVRMGKTSLEKIGFEANWRCGITIECAADWRRNPIHGSI